MLYSTFLWENQTPYILKKKLSSASDLRDIVASLNEDQDATEAITAMLSDMYLAEICQIDTKKGPLVEFPSSVNENVYCKIVEQGMHCCPHLVTMIINFDHYGQLSSK